MNTVLVHPSATIAPSAQLGPDTQVWINVQVREDARIGRECILGKDVYIDARVQIGDRCKIQNGALIYTAATLEEGVFVGPGACLTNDRIPRALTLEGELARAEDWQAGHIHIRRGASVGAGAIVLTDLVIGEYAMIGAGAVVTRDVPAHTLVVGNPARHIGYVCRCGHRLTPDQTGGLWTCARDGLVYAPASDGGLKSILT